MHERPADPVRRRPEPSWPTAAAAFASGVLFVLSSALTRGGLHDDVSPLAVVWLGFGVASTYAALTVWRPWPIPWPGVWVLVKRSGFLVTVLGWILGCVIIFGPPNDPHGHDTRYQNRCRSHLEYLGFATESYAIDHGGKYPDRPEALLTDGGVNPSVFICDSTRESAAEGKTPAEIADVFASGGHMSYIYVGRGQTTATTRPDTVLFYESARNHVRDNPGIHVLYAGDRVEYLQGEAVNQFLGDMYWRSQPGR